MASIQPIQVFEITAGGGTIALEASNGIYPYIITGSATLAAPWAIVADSTETSPFPLTGDNTGASFTIIYNASITVGASTITVFGRELTAQEALVDCLIVATCNAEDGSTFTVNVLPNFNTWAAWITTAMFGAGVVDTAALENLGVTTGKLAALCVTAAKIANATITTTQIAAATILAANIANGTITATQLADATITGAKIAATTIDTGNIVLLAITTGLLAAKAVTTTKIADAAVGTLQLNDGGVTAAKIAAACIGAAQMTASANTEIISASLSFETGQQLAYQILVPYACTLVGARYQVVKALADTDAGTIQLQNDSLTNMTGGLTSLAASTAIGTTAVAAPTVNNTFTAGQNIRAVTAKTTVGGILQAFFTVQRT